MPLQPSRQSSPTLLLPSQSVQALSTVLIPPRLPSSKKPRRRHPTHLNPKTQLTAPAAPACCPYAPTASTSPISPQRIERKRERRTHHHQHSPSSPVSQAARAFPPYPLLSRWGEKRGWKLGGECGPWELIRRRVPRALEERRRVETCEFSLVGECDDVAGVEWEGCWEC